MTKLKIPEPVSKWRLFVLGYAHCKRKGMVKIDIGDVFYAMQEIVNKASGAGRFGDGASKQALDNYITNS